MRCTHCHHENTSDAAACGGCGVSLTIHPSGSPAHARAERRHLTVMFCDLVGSAQLAETLDPEDLKDVIHEYREVCNKVIERYGGLVAQYLGDGILVYFGFPRAHEDDAARATHAGLEILAELRSTATCGAGRSVPGLRARISIHSGPVVVLPPAVEGREPQAIGHTMNVASRLQAITEPNSLVVSADTLRLIQGRFDTREVGAQNLKGLANAVVAHEVLRPTGVESRLELASARGLSPFVGRELEVEALLARWEQAKRGAGQVILLRGEPGIGKSRLVQVVRRRLSTEPHTWLEGRCSAYHEHSAFFPVVGVLESALGFEIGDPVEVKLEKLDRALEGLDLSSPEPQSLLADLLFLSPGGVSGASLAVSAEVRRRRTLEVLQHGLLTIATRQPVVLVIEDLHWADPSTLGLLTALIDKLPNAAALVVLTFRPEFVPPWAERPHVTQIPLSALEQPQVEALVTAIAGDRVLSKDVVERVAERTDGVPLFAEELTQAVLEASSLRERQDEKDPTRATPSDIPSTLRESLMARLDRLGSAREVAQLAAVLGRDFSREVLEAVSSLDHETLAHALEQIEATELLYHRGASPRVTYVFKHALIRDAAYESLMKSTRKKMHSAIADTLEARFPDVAQTNPELLAHHFEQAHRIVEAIRYLNQAADHALARCAYEEADHLVKRALHLVDTLDRGNESKTLELDLLTTLGTIQFSTRGYGAAEVERTFSRAQRLCEELGDQTPFRVLIGVWNVRLARGDREATGALIPRFRQFVERSSDPVSKLVGHAVLGIWTFYRGEFETAHAHMAEAIRLYPHPDARRWARESRWEGALYAFAYDMSSLWILGYAEQARRVRDELLAQAEKAGDPYSRAIAMSYSVSLAHDEGDVDLAERTAETLALLAREQQMPVFLAAASCGRGWALLERGELAQGTAQIQLGLNLYRMAGVIVAYTFYLTYLADAQLRNGNVEAGLAAVDEGLLQCDTGLARFHESQLRRLKGELLLRRGDRDEAEPLLREALEIAQRQGARSLELSAAMSLARFLSNEGRKEAATALLAERYGWFTEGLDTGHLLAARALLDQLA
jgi:class 3 adenylate cyclase/predicted ATPase